MILTKKIDDMTAGLWEWQGRRGRSWSWTDIATVVARVNRGARLLDDVRTGWVEKILPEKLDMSNGEFCVIGQVYGEYGEYVGVPFGIVDDDEPIDEPIEHGFLTEVQPGEMIPYELLDRVWVYMLTERNQEGRPVVLQMPERQPFNVYVEALIEANVLAFLGNEVVELVEA